MSTNSKSDAAARTVFLVAASTSIIIVSLIFIFLFKESFGFFVDPGVSRLFETRWNPVSFERPAFGLAPLLSGSLLVTAIASVIAFPCGLLGAVYLSEVASQREREILKPIVELLAGVPSVVLGFFGLITLGPFIKWIFGLSSSLNALTGGILLGFMAIPTIISISEDALRNVPISYRQASHALGASNMETVWYVTVPAAISGIIAAFMLGMGRVIGETMAVLMVTGNASLITLNPFESVRTMTATIAGEMGEVARNSQHYGALFCTGLVLMLITFALNMVAQLTFKRFRTK